MEYARISEVPDLDHAILIGAFAGWNDAASAATWAVKFLINQWEATAFAEIESDPFFDFTATRPQVRINNGAIRRMTWPTNRFYVHKAPRNAGETRPRDVVLLLGEEPHYHWKTFVQEVVDVCRQCQVEDMVLLGSYVAEVPHTAPVPIQGTASTASILRKMERASIERSGYEGPTGIPTALQDGARKEGFESSSLWGAAPHYVSATPNLAVSLALLQKLDALYSFDLRLVDLNRASRRFTERVSTLVASDPEVSAYVRTLEERAQERGDLAGMSLANDASGVHRIPTEGELPSPEEAVQDVEEWLRQFRDQGEGEGEGEGE